MARSGERGGHREAFQEDHSRVQSGRNRPTVPPQFGSWRLRGLATIANIAQQVDNRIHPFKDLRALLL